MIEAREPTGRALLELAYAPSEPSPRALAAWLVGRALAGFVVIALILVAELEFGAGEFAFSSTVFALLGAFLVGGAVVSGVLARRGVSRRVIGFPLVMMDLFAIAVIVYLTGGATSLFATLFGVEIVLAALVLGPEAALITAGTAIALHLFVALGLRAEILPVPPDAPRGMYEIAPVALSLALSGHALALLVVGLLSRALAVRVRLAGGHVMKAQESARRLERLNASIVQGIGSGLVTIDDDGRILSANPAAERIFGAGREALIGRDARTFFPFEGISLPPSSAMRLDGTGKRADGSEFPCGLTVSRLPDDGRALSLVVFQDLTELRRLQQKAEQAERLAALGRIATSLAHEIRNPLGAISGSVQLVREGASLDEDERKLLGIVSREVERLDDLVATMLAASRPREPVRRRFDLAKVAREVIDLVRRGPHVERKGEIALLGDEEVWVFADEQQIRQVLWNLLKNALVATPDGGRIEVLLTQRDGGARIDVDDGGPGIPEESRARLFEPFVSGRPLGVGLGLSIVDQLVRAHGGRVEIDDSPLGGARFTVEIEDPPRESSPGSARDGRGEEPA